MRGPVAVLSVALLLVAAGASDARAQVASVAGVAQQYCVSCHNARSKTGDLVLEGAPLTDVAGHAEIWEKALRKVRAGAMPPAGLPRPDAATTTAFVRTIEKELDAGGSASIASRTRRDPPHTGPSSGGSALHRLNRTEYGNAIRDLIDLEIDPAALLPPDDSSAGFDNNADLLGVSPALLERYLAAAAKISAIAVGNPSIGASSEIYRVRGDASQIEHVEGLPIGTRGGLVATHTFPLDGEYVIKVKLLDTNMGAVRGLEEPHQVEVTIDGQRVFLMSVGGERDFKVSANNATDIAVELDTRLTVRVAVKAGPHLVGATFLQRSAAAGGTRLQAFRRSTIDMMHHGGLPHVANVTVSGPFNASGPGDTPSRRRIFTCSPARPSDELPCATGIITSLARRAYRRPATADELGRLMAFYRSGRADGSFERGIEMALRGVLANPKFLLRSESAATSDLDLASRLSFFIWSSIPDEELIDLAVTRRLSRPGVLDQQVRRMLADPRARALATNFAAQWLQLRNLRSAAPDKNLFPDFDDNLRQAFQRETEMFVGSVIQEDRPVLDLLTADYSFLNERLAWHYGILGVKGSHFRRVTLTQPERQGLLGQGSILLLTSHADRTSPVVRGKWVLENLLGVPPPPPAANVPPLEEQDGGLSVRARMESHRRSPTCAACHRIMDPIGLALENFDAIGAWRTRDSGAPIDASGQLMDGTAVDGPVGLRRALLAKPDVFVGNLAEKLLTYALGRKVEYYDMPAVRTIVRDAARQEHRFRALIMGVVASRPFRMPSQPPDGGRGTH
jgi:mono/diheme cytochrome c family protein